MKTQKIRDLKKERFNYTDDINSFNFKDSLNNLFCIYNIKDLAVMRDLQSLYSKISRIMVKGRGTVSHEQMPDILEEFWNSRNIVTEEIDGKLLTKRVKEIKDELLDLNEKYYEEESIMNAIVSIIRVPEFFYLSHEELSSIQKNWQENLDQVSMLSNKKSIFKKGNKDTDFVELVEMNKEEIKNHCGVYDENLIPTFITYLNLELFKHPRVKMYIKQIRKELKTVLKEIELKGSFIHLHTKNSSSFFGEKSMIADNFLEPKDSLIPEHLAKKYLNYPRLKTDIEGNYLKLGFGLGPDFKLRNVVFTNAMYQNFCAPIRIAAKRTDRWFRKENYINPNRTDSQVADFLSIINERRDKRYKVCYDLSKYSDYLLAQIIDRIIDLICENEEYGSVVKEIMRLRIYKDGKFYPILFGTGAGAKGNFDLITVAHIVIDDFSSYYYGYTVENMNFVSDDNYSDSDDEEISESLKIVYTHMNCKLNTKKSSAIEDKGKVSFCNRHFWLENDRYRPWNGVPPGLWMKEIYSFTRLNSIVKIMKETNQKDIMIGINNLYRKNKQRIEREFLINKSPISCEEVWKNLQNVPWELNGFMELDLFNEPEEVEEWARDLYENLDQYVFHMKNNEMVSKVLEKYDKIFPDHPVFDILCFQNTEYLEIINNIEESFSVLSEYPTRENHRSFMIAARRAIMKFSKSDHESNRISSKDRTSDYFNEDKFVTRNYRKITNYVSQRLTEEEIRILQTYETKYPIAEMYLKLVNGLVRNGRSPFYDPNSFVAMKQTRKESNETIVVRLYTNSASSRSRNRNTVYENWNYSEENTWFVFNQIYPENECDFEYAKACVQRLANVIGKLKHKREKEIAELLELV
jgi:hypothetical protein